MVLQKNPKKGGFFPRRILIAFFAAENLVRLVYYFLLPTGTLKPTLFSTFILTELPTFLLFTTLTILLFLWGVMLNDKLASAAAVDSAVSKLRIMCLIANGIMYGILVLLIILFETLPTSSTVSNTSCGVTTIIPAAVQTTPGYKISLVYKYFISIIAFLISAGFVFYGIAMYRRIMQLKSKSQEHIKKIFLVTMMGGLSFLMHAIILVVQAAETNAIFLAVIIFLTFSELAPQLLFMYIYGYKTIRQTKSEHSTEYSGGRQTHVSSSNIEMSKTNTTLLN